MSEYNLMQTLMKVWISRLKYTEVDTGVGLIERKGTVVPVNVFIFYLSTDLYLFYNTLPYVFPHGAW